MPTNNITKIRQVFHTTVAFYQEGFWKCWKTRRLFISSLIFSVLLAMASLIFIYAASDAAVRDSFSWYSVIVCTVLFLVLFVLRDTLHDFGADVPRAWPRWISWGVVFNLIIVVIATLLSAFVKASLEIKTVIFSIASLGLLLALIILQVRIIPGVLNVISSALARIPVISYLFRKWLSARVLYGLLCVVITIPVVFGIFFDGIKGDLEYLLALGVLSIGVICAIAYSKNLFTETGHTLVIRVMPHILFFNILATLPWELFLSNMPDFKKESGGYSLVVSFGLSLLITVGSVLYLASFRFRKGPVKELKEGTELRAESIQSRVEHYIDAHGLSDRFCNNIKRADGGVFGITGVRGAGKSALTRHVLDALKNKFFTSEITAPVRNDSDMGFFMVICRNVCRHVLDDLTPVLFGKKYTATSDLWLQAGKLIMGIALFAVCVFGVANYAKQFAPWLFFEADPVDALIRDTNNRIALNKSDPLLGKYTDIKPGVIFPLLAERWATDDLLQQIEHVLSSRRKGKTSSDKRFVLVPKPSKYSFHFVPAPVENNDIKLFLWKHNKRLELEGGSTEPYAFFKNMFAGKKVGRVQVNDSSLSWIKGSRDIIKTTKIEAPFRLSFNKINDLMNITRSDNESLQKNILLSHVVLSLFERADPRLSFDYDKLVKFADAVRVYRNLLDGEIGVFIKNDVAINSVEDISLENLGQYSKWLTYLAIFIAIVVLSLTGKYIWRVAYSTFYTILNRQYLDVYTEAKDFLEQLSYQSRQESSAGFSWRGFKLGQKQTLAMRDLTLPGLTARYTQFLQKVRPLYNGKLVIAIDELDKIHDPEQVKSLLTEIKGALFQPGVFYLLSISEDAARAFRRRLASGRDIFESTFDYVVDIRQMGVPAAVQMLSKREASTEGRESRENQQTGDGENQFGHSCLEVVALFGGGIPREIIRAHRLLSDTRNSIDTPTPEWATWVLMKNELEQWTANLGESNLTGATTIKIRALASKALKTIGDSPPLPSAYDEIWHDLLTCIDLIDPDGLRHSVGYLAEGNGKDNNEDVLKYKEIVGDLQIVMRLLILSHLSYRILQAASKLEEYAPGILECHRALADKPALAEYLLQELHGETG